MSTLRQKHHLVYLPTWLSQACKFLAVGMLNTLVDAGVYLALTRGLPFFAATPAPAKAISYTAGVLNSFYWNKTWTFRSRAKAQRTFLTFVMVNLLGVLLNAVAMYLSLTLMGLPEGLSFGLASGATLAWNFTASKFIVFKNPTELNYGG
ncbi:MAG: GtrA family protein [Chloroflexota bacterium]